MAMKAAQNLLYSTVVARVLCLSAASLQGLS